MAQAAVRSITTLSGHVLTFVGDETDEYFRGIEAFHNGSPQFENYIRSHLKCDAVCIDVGANIGLTALLMAAYCPQGRVFAFEASPKNAAFLRQNIERNNILNCVVIEAAVGNEIGALTFFQSEFGAGSHVMKGDPSSDSRIVEVPVTTLDEVFVEKAAAPRIDFIKIDVEGFEPVAINGASRLLERDRCPIFMEFNSWCLQLHHEFNPFVFGHALVSKFEFSTVDKAGALAPVNPDDMHGFMYRNIFQNGCVDDVVLRLREGERVPQVADMVKGMEDRRNHYELVERGYRRRRTAGDGDKNANLQFLRALAILMVLAAHLSITDSFLMQLPFSFVNPGWIGVELFFVVSGYVVTQSFSRSAFDTSAFVIRRVFRLYPLLAFFLLMTVLVKLVCDGLEVTGPPLFVPSFQMLWHQSLAILFGYHPTTEWGVTYTNRAVWSLMAEFQFYAALALFVAFLNLVSFDTKDHLRSLLAAACVIYAVGVIARLLVSFGHSFVPGDLVIGSMFDFIALGVILATMPTTWRERLSNLARPVAWVLIPAAMLLVGVVGAPYVKPGISPAAYNLSVLALGALFMLVVAAGVSERGGLWLSDRARLLGNFIGDRSYSIFLLHLPVFSIAWALGQHFGFDDGYWRWPLFQLGVSAILLPPLVEITYRWIELPMIARGKAICDALKDLRKSGARGSMNGRSAQALGVERI